jgi:hypothetical protein
MLPPARFDRLVRFSENRSGNLSLIAGMQSVSEFLGGVLLPNSRVRLRSRSGSGAVRSNCFIEPKMVREVFWKGVF